MSHERRLFIEKIQVYTAMVICVILMYCFLWQQVTPNGIDRVAAYFPGGNLGQLMIAVAYYWLFCVVAAVITSVTRVQGAMAAALAGLSAVAMRSESMHFIINRNEGNLKALAGKMLPELVIWAVAIWIGTVIVRFIWHKTMVWACESEPVNESLLEKGDFAWLLLGVVGFSGLSGQARAKFLSQTVMTAIVRAIIAALVLTILLNKAFDPERGQVIFAMFAAFFLSSFAVAWSDAARDSDLATVLSALLLGLVITGKLMLSGSAAPAPLEWMGLKSWSMALPIDWMAAGCFGGFTGRWMALRMFHDTPPDQHEGETLVEPSNLSELAGEVVSKTFK